MVGTVASAPQPAPSQITQRIRERAAAAREVGTEPPKTPDTRARDGVPAWKRRIVDELAAELDRRGASRGARASERLNAENVDARITSLSREIRALARDRTGYDQPGASRVGVVVNRAV
jgi:hypothetical protein